jgi:hypothetical protein
MAAKEKEKEFSQVILKDEEGNRYTLEFSRRVVDAMERNGFELEPGKPVAMVTDLVQGAFRMHAKEHGRLTPDRIMEIWAHQRKKDELLTALTKLYMKPVNDLMAEPEGAADEGPTWETA